MTVPRVLVTGGSGFLGSAIVGACSEVGMCVRASGRSSRAPAGCRDYVTADLLHTPNLKPLFEGGLDAVVHSAGLAHQFRMVPGMDTAFIAVNVEGTLRVLRAAIAAGVRHFVLLSSVSVYGSPQAAVCDESFPCQPQGAYTRSKLLAEQRAMDAAREAGMRLTILRVATVYGEGDPGNVARLMKSLDRGRFVWIGDGANRKSLIHREDVARGCVAVLRSDGRDSRVFNLAAHPCTMREVVDGLAAALGKAPPRWHIPAKPLLLATRVAGSLSGNRGRVGRLHATMTKWLSNDVYSAERFYRTFQFSPTIDLRDGLQREVAWYRSAALGRAEGDRQLVRMPS